jgi:hypothetical protein
MALIQASSEFTKRILSIFGTIFIARRSYLGFQAQLASQSYLIALSLQLQRQAHTWPKTIELINQLISNLSVYYIMVLQNGVPPTLRHEQEIDTSRNYFSASAKADYFI